MPISRKDFNTGNFKEVADRGEDHPVTAILKKNRDKAYKVSELVKETGRVDSAIRRILRTLLKKGKVVKKSPYYMWKK